MEWYRQVQFIAAVPMPQETADEYGTTVNGMWVAPGLRSNQDVATAHAKGQRVLFSVPLIALTPRVYEAEENRYLLDEVCKDVDGNEALVPWYYWEDKAVYSVCIYSPALRATCSTDAGRASIGGWTSSTSTRSTRASA